MKKLPNKLSKLMRIALADLAKVERSKNISVNMDEWMHWNNSDTDIIMPLSFKIANKVDHCSVCFAGAVMAKTLNIVNSYVVFLNNDLSHKMQALDYIRQGYILDALEHFDDLYDKDMGYKWVKHYEEEKFNVAQYKYDPKQWRKDMWKIVHKLEKIGL